MAALPGRTGRNIIANFLGLGIASLLSLLLVPVYVGYLGIEAYALVGLFVVVQSWIALLDLGMTPTLGREMARFTAGSLDATSLRTLLRSLELVYLGLALIIVLLLSLTSNVIASRWLGASTLPVADIARAMQMLGAVVALRFCEGLYRGGLLGLQLQVWVNAAGTALALLRSLGALAVLALVSPSITAFFLWQGAVSLLTVLVMGLKLHASLPPTPGIARFSLAALARIRHFAGGVFAASLLGVALTQLDKLLLSRLLPLAEFGQFMLASALIGVLYLVSWPVVQAVAPRLVTLAEHRDGTSLGHSYHLFTQLVVVLLVPVAATMMIFPQQVLWVWSGDEALSRAIAPVLQLLALGTGLNALLQMPGQLQLAHGWTALSVRLNLAAVTLLLPALLWAVPRGGGVAAASVWATLNLLYLAVMVPLMHRRLLPGEMARWYLVDLLRPGLAGALVLGASALLVNGMTLGRWDTLFLIGSAALLAMLAAALAAPLVRQAGLAQVSRWRARPAP